MGEEKGEEKGSSYRYWVRENTADAAPLPLPKKLSSNDSLLSNSNLLGSIWNSAGTWEEKNLNKWASDRIKELIVSVGSLEFSGGKAEITDVSKCSGDGRISAVQLSTGIFLAAFLVTVRNKKRVGYTYELSLKLKGEWIIKEEKKTIKGYMDIPEFSFGELDDLLMEVRLSDDKDLLQQEKFQIIQDMKQFLEPVREKLLQFEKELKDR